jgi:hypothetical protein
MVAGCRRAVNPPPTSPCSCGRSHAPLAQGAPCRRQQGGSAPFAGLGPSRGWPTPSGLTCRLWDADATAVRFPGRRVNWRAKRRVDRANPALGSMANARGPWALAPCAANPPITSTARVRARNASAARALTPKPGIAGRAAFTPRLLLAHGVNGVGEFVLRGELRQDHAHSRVNQVARSGT